MPKPTPSTPSTPPANQGGTFRRVLGIGLLAVSVGVLGAYTLDLHSHTCDQCGRRWWHLGAFNLGDKPAHTCQCGSEQWWKSGVPPELRHAHNVAARDSFMNPPGTLPPPDPLGLFRR